MKKGGNGMRPVRFPDLSKRPFHLKVIRIMEAAPSVLFNAWTKQFDHWFAAPGSVIMQGEVNTAFFFETEYRDKGILEESSKKI